MYEAQQAHYYGRLFRVNVTFNGEIQCFLQVYQLTLL